MNNSRVVTHIINGKSLTEIDNLLKNKGIILTDNNLVSSTITTNSDGMRFVVTTWRESKVISPGNIEYKQYPNEL